MDQDYGKDIMTSKPKLVRKKNKSIKLMEKNRPVGFNKAHKKAIEKSTNFRPKKLQ